MNVFTSDARFQRELFFANALLPLFLLLWDWRMGKLGANPTEYVTRATGVLALIFMVVTLLVTPLRKWTGWHWLARHRRLFGLIAAFYAFAHLLTYLLFDRDLKLATVPEDVWKRPFIAVGMLAFLLMIPLAATSANAAIKRLGGKRWTRLHRLTYVVAIAGVVHFWMIVKSDIRWPVAFGAAVAALLGYRIFAALTKPRASTAVIAERGR